MDFLAEEVRVPPPLYEEVLVGKPDYITIPKLKTLVFKLMEDLEGWCSIEKAALLIDLIFMIRPQKVVEIGVFGGKSLIPIAMALKEIGTGRVIGIDPWSSTESAVGMKGADADFWSRLDHDQIYRGFFKKIEKLGLENTVLLLQETSAQAEPIPDIDILHIDGNHSEISSLIDVYKWVPFVRSGGLIILNDSNWSTTKKSAAWLDGSCIRFAEFSDGNVWTIWIKP